MRQLVAGGAQSLAIKQATQEPLPSHTVPLLSLHGTPGGASTSMHMKTIGLHRLALHAVVVVAGQSAGMEQPTTHEPLPSHTVPPPSLQGVPATALAAPHAPLVQVLLLHAVACAGQSLGALQPPPWSGTPMSDDAAPGQVRALSMHDPLHGDWPTRHEISAGVEQLAIKIAISVPRNRTRTILSFARSRSQENSAAFQVSVIK